MRRYWPVWLRFLLSLALVACVYKFYTGWYCFERRGAGPGVTFSPTKAYIARQPIHAQLQSTIVEAVRAHAGGFYNRHASFTTRIIFSLSTVFPAALIGAACFHVVSRWRGVRSELFEQPRCRKCQYRLRGLSGTRCPECGEAI